MPIDAKTSATALLLVDAAEFAPGPSTATAPGCTVGTGVVRRSIVGDGTELAQLLLEAMLVVFEPLGDLDLLSFRELVVGVMLVFLGSLEVLLDLLSGFSNGTISFFKESFLLLRKERTTSPAASVVANSLVLSCLASFPSSSTIFDAEAKAPTFP